MTKLLVFGSRDGNDVKLVYETLDKVSLKIGGVSLVVHGACRGYDMLSDRWAQQRGIERDPHEVTSKMWNEEGNSAGPKRNTRMLVAHPDMKYAVKFPGGSGTADMYKKALKKGLNVYDVESDQWSEGDN